MDVMNEMSREELDKARAKMQDLYNSNPYSDVLTGGLQQNTPLLIDWINSTSSSDIQPLSNGSRILVAGCGAGDEVFMLGQLFPQAEVIGIDFSEQSIIRALELKEEKSITNVGFAVADLMSSDWVGQYKTFDFILCRGVADYVLDPKILLNTLHQCLNDEGVICMMMNTPFHPAAKIRRAFKALGINPEDYSDKRNERILLQIVDHFLGSDARMDGIGTAPFSYLKVDIFAPIAHHYSLEKWIKIAQASELYFAGAMDVLLDLMQLDNEHLPYFYKLNKFGLTSWFANLSQRTGMQILLKKKPVIEPDFSEFKHLLAWKPKLEESLSKLPVLEGDPHVLRSLSLQFEGLPDLLINCFAYELEILRLCNGIMELNEIIKKVGVKVDEASLTATLFRTYHYGLIS